MPRSKTKPQSAVEPASTGWAAPEGEAAELARQLGAVAKECDVIVRYVLGLLVVPIEVTASAERLDAWLAEVRPPN